MVIYLPLLFAEGRPTSLETITINQLEKFIPFMLSCCPEASNGPPLWWEPMVPYRFPLIRNPGLTPQRWLSLLKQIVCRCYEVHKCEHLLRFCARLCQLPPDKLHFKETSGGFISIINRANDKLIVTFKKKNKIYDQKNCLPTSPFKSLLPLKRNTQPPRELQPIEDIYLCNYCDCEFTSAKDAIAHEVVCEGKGEEDTQNEAVDQSAVMRYFGLAPSKASPKKPSTTTRRGTSVKLTGRSYMQVPFSSPLGMKMGANVTGLSNEMKVEYISKIELNCCMKTTKTNSTHQTRRPRKIMAAPRSRKLKNAFWSHTYCFNKADRREKLITLKSGLNKRARNLLKKCKRVVVLVERLPLLDPLAIHAAATISQYRISADSVLKVNEAKTICIDLTDSDDENLKENCGVSSSDVYLNSSNHKRPPLHEWSSTPTSMRQSTESVSAPISSFTSLTGSSLLPIPSL